ncbi:hypothetical protein [Sorangium sp. So ce362]|uniref:hypothetical protein n=1 Tax=Sorangium sp. So ce362 TaxID=3133303 RepID=UPI003F5D91BD
MALFATINGERVLTASLHVPYGGLWCADVELDQPRTLAGAAIVKLGGLELRGVIAPARSGAFQGRARVRVIAGAGGWFRRCKARQFYHVSAGVTLRSAVTALAADVGETFDPTGLNARIGHYFIREAAPASRVLAQLLGSTPWWVDYPGITRAGQRPAVEPAEGAYQLLDFDERWKVAELALDDPAQVVIGSVLRDRLERPLAVRELHFEMTRGALRASAFGREL